MMQAVFELTILRRYDVSIIRPTLLLLYLKERVDRYGHGKKYQIVGCRPAYPGIDIRFRASRYLYNTNSRDPQDDGS